MPDPLIPPSAVLAAQSDLMASLRLAADALGRIRAVEGPDDYDAVRSWVLSLSDRDKSFMLVGLLVVCWNVLDPALDAAYLTQCEVDLPPPSENVPADTVRAGDILRLVDSETDELSEEVVVSVSLSGADATLTFEHADPITVPRNRCVVRTTRFT